MTEVSLVLHNLWDKFRNLYSTTAIEGTPVKLDELLSSFFSPGADYYYYVVDFTTRKLEFIHQNIRAVLGFDPATVCFDDILNCIHPDDIDYVSKAEEAMCNFGYLNIGKDLISKYKTSYCFRLRTADGSYRLFHHQAIHIGVDRAGRISKAVNIHTNISHLVSCNNYQAAIIGIMGEKGFYQFDVMNDPAVPRVSKYSSREREVIALLAKGYRSKEIAVSLNISVHTVCNHRKKIMKKSGANNSAELMAACRKESLFQTGKH